MTEPEHEFDSWAAEIACQIAGRWEVGHVGDLKNALELIDLLDDSDRLEQKVRDAIPKVLSSADTVEEWDVVADYLADSTVEFDVDRAVLFDDFHDWAEGLLRFNLDTVRDVEEFAELERTAERFDVATDNDEWRAAYDEVVRRQDDSPRSRPAPAAARVERDADDTELRTLFERLNG